MPFAQLVIGPPGAGKSTYCNGMQQFMSAIGRKCSVVNLDPANDQTSYTPALDVRELVTLEEIMAEDTLGPNGGVLYALEEIETNFDWLKEGLGKLGGISLFPFTYCLRRGRSLIYFPSFVRGLCPIRLSRPSRALYTSRFPSEYILSDTTTWVQSLHTLLSPSLKNPSR